MENNNRQGCREEAIGFGLFILAGRYERFTDGIFGAWQGKEDRKLYSNDELYTLYKQQSIEPCATSSPDEKDLIIHGLEEGSQQWEEEYDSARKIIEQLVEQSGILYTYGSRIEGIYQKFPELLKSAKEFLSKYQHQ